MKKILLMAVVMLITVVSFSGVAQASESNTDDWYKQALKSVENERTDAYALDYYKYSTWAQTPLYVKQAKKITAGITDDYAKVKAIFDWTQEHITYSYTDGKSLDVVDGYIAGTCVTFAANTKYLLQAAGFPTKTIVGSAYTEYDGFGGHEWNEVFVDGRWIYIDSTWGEFDLPITEWGKDHLIGPYIKTLDAEAWDGSLYFVDVSKNRLVKEVKNFPINGLVSSTYGFNIKNLYFDTEYKKAFTLNTLQVNSQNAIIYVKVTATKKYKVTFNSNSGTPVKAVTVTANSKITNPTNPTRKGYVFIGWFKDSKCTKKWNFSTGKVIADITLYAGWQKK